MKRCLLCSTTSKLNLEHYVPQWLSTDCKAREIEIHHGNAVRGKITNHRKVGTLRTAQTRILCSDCNGKLGKGLEVDVRKQIQPYIVPDAKFEKLSIPNPELLLIWVTLRAIEVGEVLKKPLTQMRIGTDLVAMCRAGRDQNLPFVWPWVTLDLEAVRIKQQTVGISVSNSFYSAERGEVKTQNGFWFFLQMNSLGLLLLHAPNAKRNFAKGYAMKLFPPGIRSQNQHGISTNQIPEYENLWDIQSKLTFLNTEG